MKKQALIMYASNGYNTYSEDDKQKVIDILDSLIDSDTGKQYLITIEEVEKINH